jgi:hypothetical protein
MRLFKTVLVLIAATACAHAEDKPLSSDTKADTVKTPAKLPFYLITDYLPLAIYDGDGVTGCFRVENTTGAEAKLELSLTALDEKGATLRQNAKQVTAPVSGFASCQDSQDSHSVTSVRFTLKKDAEKLGEAMVRLIRESDPWPVTKVANGRLVVAESGEILVLAVHRVIRVQERDYAPIKWLIGKDEPAKKEAAGNALIFVPGRWPLAKNAVEQKGVKWLLLGPYPPDGSTPILRALDQVVTTLTKDPSLLGTGPDKPRVSICLPPEDLGVATDPRVYRIVVDGLLARLQALGVKQLGIVPPFQFGTPEKYWERICAEVQESAAAYGARAVDPADFLNEKLWRVDPETEGAYGACPNSNGLKRIEQALVDLVP